MPKSAGLADPGAACDLGRFVLLDDVAGNGESFFLSRALQLLRRERPSILSVISYADPIRRIDEDGRMFLPGHVGTLYAVMGSRYVGRSSPRIDLMLPSGRPVSPRALFKIRNAEMGQRYATDALVQDGARPPRLGEAPAAWIEDLVARGFLRRRRHPGNHIYVFPLTRAARIAARRIPAMPYPLLDRSAIGGDVTQLPIFARTA